MYHCFFRCGASPFFRARGLVFFPILCCIDLFFFTGGGVVVMLWPASRPFADHPVLSDDRAGGGPAKEIEQRGPMLYPHNE